MSKGLVYYFRYPSNAIAGMQPLTLEERGAYNTIIDLIYDQGGSIEDDRTLLSYLACDIRVWRRIRTRLLQLDKIRVDKDGRISNTKATKELAAAEARQEVARKSGLSSAEVRRKSAKKTNKNNGSRQLSRDKGIEASLTEKASIPGDAARPLEKRAALPDGVRASLAKALGEEFVASWMGRSGWTEVPTRTLTPGGTTAFNAIRRSKEARDTLLTLGITLVDPALRKTA